MCGEHPATRASNSSLWGSSPHVRGTPGDAVLLGFGAGIIPACAGNTRSRCIRTMVSWDHPRMCGEHYRHVPIGLIILGSSPHVRGTPHEQMIYVDTVGIIPACAGNTRSSSASSSSSWDHPRMCGEHSSNCCLAFFHGGSSPHVRGTRQQHHREKGTIGIIPACAGNTISQRFSTMEVRDHPRMCGEHLDSSVLQ